MPGAEYRMHCHPNNFLTGVYYLATHEGGEAINFNDLRSQIAISELELTENRRRNAGLPGEPALSPALPNAFDFE